MEQAIPSTVKKALIVRVSPSINLPLGAWYAGHNPARRSSSTTMTLRLAGQPFWLNSNKGTKSLTGFFATFYARGTFGNSAAPKIGSCLVGQFWGLTQPVHPHLFRHQMITYLTLRVYRMHRSN